MTTLPDNVESALIHQKDKILAEINDGYSPRDFETVLAQIDFIRELWEAIGYGYKTRELLARLRDATEAARDRDNQYSEARQLRKNSYAWKKHNDDVARFNTIIARCSS